MNDSVTWTILSDDEQLSKDKSPFKVDLPWDVMRELIPFNDVFFSHIFPSLVGKAS